ncbi:acyl carrier protein [Amycolatopsis sp. lyj-108]|uniref:acyl carrier protein n=1 Tax=Amycolatopsis sp. lyj-108 TaxID=2789286 RepID=UPI003978B87C
MGHRSLTDVRTDQSFRSTGFDSLASVELRTRLANTLGLRLAATAVLDHPTPESLARHIETLLTESGD